MAVIYYTSLTYNNSEIFHNVENTAPVTVTYNGDTLVTIENGSKEFDCHDKLFATNVVVGNKELDCANKLASSNIIITAIPFDVPVQSGDTLTLGSVYAATQTGSTLAIS